MTSSGLSSPARAVDVGSTARWLLKPLGLVAFVGVLGYFVLGPLVRLQSKAFADGAAGYRTAFTADRIGRTIAYTSAWRWARSPSPWSSARCSPGPPPGCHRSCASCAWSPSCRSWCRPSPASSAGRSCCRRAPATSTPHSGRCRGGRPRGGPDRRLHDAVDRHHHRDRADGVRVPLRRRRLREHQCRAPRSRPGRRLVADRCVLPGDPAAAAPDPAVRRRRRPAARARTVHRPAAARTNRRHRRRHHRDLRRHDARPRSSTAARPRSARPCWCSA